MSAASRERQRFLHLRRGFATWDAFFAAQRVAATKWVEPPDVKAAREAWEKKTFCDEHGNPRELVPIEVAYPPREKACDSCLTLAGDVVGLTT